MTSELGIAKMKLSSSEYHVITSKEKVANLREGDRIKYEPYGTNFGWFHSKVE